MGLLPQYSIGDLGRSRGRGRGTRVSMGSDIGESEQPTCGGGGGGMRGGGGRFAWRIHQE